MAEKPKLVRGTVAGATVQVTEEKAALLGAAFEPEKATAKKASSSTTKKS